MISEGKKKHDDNRVMYLRCPREVQMTCRCHKKPDGKNDMYSCGSDEVRMIVGCQKPAAQ